MSKKVLILGAGFGGLELSSRLAEGLGDEADITLIDKSDRFIFGFLKFELMLGRAELPDVSFYYSDFAKPGVEFRQETVTSIDPQRRRVTTNKQTYDADILVVALGADYDFAATPGFVEGGHEFYSVPGAIALNQVLQNFKSGKLVVGVIGQPYKCPPAPSEAVILLDEWFEERGLRNDIEITLVSQWVSPLPPSPGATKAFLDKFSERNISFMAESIITAIDPTSKTALLQDGGRVPYDLFIGIPVHQVPAVVEDSGLVVDGWVAVSETNLATRFPGVYAIGDVTSAPVPKAGAFAESAARTVADHVIAEINGSGDTEPFDGKGTCYVEFGDRLVGRLDVDFFPGREPTAPFVLPSEAVAREKKEFVTLRRKRWLGV